MKLFLLSPARCGGERAAMLAGSSRSELGKQLHLGDAEIGDVFAWLSALYFRGKLTYARRFAAPPAGKPGVLVMAPGVGLVPHDTPISADQLRRMGTVDVQSEAFTAPLRRDAALVDRATGGAVDFVLLGSVASDKYVETLLDVLGERLLFPDSFVGRGDMSRGGLLLRAARGGEELSYAQVAGAVLRGKRPPRLPRRRRDKSE